MYNEGLKIKNITANSSFIDFTHYGARIKKVLAETFWIFVKPLLFLKWNVLQ